MAKGFPYFKFVVTEWMTGDIVYEDFNVQGLFINICALYWQRDGKLSIEDINKRYKNPPELEALIGSFFSVTDGFISIKFLNEQFEDVAHISKVNSENGQKGGRPKITGRLSTDNQSVTETKPTDNQPTSEKKQRRKEEDKEEDKNKEIVGSAASAAETKESLRLVRELAFMEDLRQYVPVYGKEMIRMFFDYWREPTKSKVKMKYEIERTWDLKLRLITWQKRGDTFKTNGKPYSGITTNNKVAQS